jgi:sucrose-phosphate synthase
MLCNIASTASEGQPQLSFSQPHTCVLNDGARLRLHCLLLLQVSHKSNVHMADQEDARLQYLSWRVWGMKRKHALVQMQRDAEADLVESELSETRSEELTGPVLADAEEVANLVRSAPTPALPRLTVQPASASAADLDAYDHDDRDNLFSPVAPGSPAAGELIVHTTLTADRVPKLYCVLISMHGLVRGEHMELGKDPDTGGQVGVGCALQQCTS